MSSEQRKRFLRVKESRDLALEREQGAIGLALAALREAEAHLELERTNLERARRERADKSGELTMSEWRAAEEWRVTLERRVDSAERAVSEAKAAVDVARGRVSEAKIKVEQAGVLVRRAEQSEHRQQERQEQRDSDQWVLGRQAHDTAPPRR